MPSFSRPGPARRRGGDLAPGGRGVTERAVRPAPRGPVPAGHWSQPITQETPVDTTMTALHEHYVRRVNAAVTEDRMDLVQELYEQYFEEALRRLLETSAV